MNSPWVREASECCSSSCCLNPLLGFPKSLNHSFKSIDSATFQYDFATATTTSLYPHTQFTNHESLPKLQEAFLSFTRAHPQYLQTVEADQIRGGDYYHLSLLNHVCLDYIGHGLFSYSQQQGHRNGASIASTSSAPPTSPDPRRSELPFFEISFKTVTLNSQIEHGGEEGDFESILRRRIMRFLNISEDDYSMVFTANQTLAFTLVAESYPFQTNRNLLTVYDHENEGVEAIIESSKRRGVRAMSAEFKWPKLKICSGKLKQIVTGKKKSNRGLFVFPLQSRVTGARYSYQWMNIARENGWHVLLDASALGPKDMDTLGLSLFRPDFFICTCFKVFGEDPSGFGCLFVKKSHSSMLNQLSIASSRGIVSLVPAIKPSQLPDLPASTSTYTEQTSKQEPRKDDLSAPSSSSKAFQQTDAGHLTYNETDSNREQKQLPPSEIEEAENCVQSTRSKDQESTNTMTSDIEFKGLDHADSLGLILINNRARYLINWLVNALLILKHPNSENGSQLIKIYGPRIRFDRAPALAFNVFDWKGQRVDPSLVQKLAGRQNISVGHEFIKNLWFPDRYQEEKEKILERRSDRTEKFDCGISVITVNLGLLTNFEDVYRVWQFVSRFSDADYVEKETWRYAALNQKTIEV
ncbi:hypothetical protein Ancab_032579 [Ancistrocladus abbreviatus]